MTDDDFPRRFGTVAIIGVGLIGGSLGMALKARRLAQRVVGIGRNSERLQEAVQLNAVDDVTTDWQAGIAEADVVVLCTTVGNILETVGEVLHGVKPGAVVTDVGSTKGAIVSQAAQATRSGSDFVGGHPMAGSERAGVQSATPTLFQEATWAITPTMDTNAHAVDVVRAMAQGVGASTLIVSPEAHDAMVATTSHLPHVIAAAFMRHAAGARVSYPETPRLSAGSFSDMTRIAASSPDIWRDVCLSNREAVLGALNHFREELSLLEQAITEKDGTAIEAFFARSATAKRDWRGE